MNISLRAGEKLYINGAVGIALVAPTTKFESAVQGLMGVQQGSGAAGQRDRDIGNATIRWR